ncbi:LOW QUALITY PROTEIN: T-cell surface glycoprotein CD1b-like [Rhynchonycteris naso]
MLLFSLLLLADLIPGGDNNQEHKCCKFNSGWNAGCLFIFLIFSLPTAFQGSISYHVIQILSFINSTAQNQGSGWLEDLQIHGWDSDSGTAIFLKPWSKGNFTNVEIIELEEIFQVYLIGFIWVLQVHVSEFQMIYM